MKSNALRDHLSGDRRPLKGEFWRCLRDQRLVEILDVQDFGIRVKIRAVVTIANVLTRRKTNCDLDDFISRYVLHSAVPQVPTQPAPAAAIASELPLEAVDPLQSGLYVFLGNEQDDWSSIDGCEVKVMTDDAYDAYISLTNDDAEDEEEECDSAIEEGTIQRFALDDPRDLRRLADLLEQRKLKKEGSHGK